MKPLTSPRVSLGNQLERERLRLEALEADENISRHGSARSKRKHSRWGRGGQDGQSSSPRQQIGSRQSSSMASGIGRLKSSFIPRVSSTIVPLRASFAEIGNPRIGVSPPSVGGGNPRAASPRPGSSVVGAGGIERKPTIAQASDAAGSVRRRSGDRTSMAQSSPRTERRGSVGSAVSGSTRLNNTMSPGVDKFQLALLRGSFAPDKQKTSSSSVLGSMKGERLPAATDLDGSLSIANQSDAASASKLKNTITSRSTMSPRPMTFAGKPTDDGLDKVELGASVSSLEGERHHTRPGRSLDGSAHMNTTLSSWGS
eukprot:Hpha_TRINITY_DN7863_c0_g1::TRINITY_DN7863_c0_g1_i2::g.185717::m.185717